jgi:hypothetical protein
MSLLTTFEELPLGTKFVLLNQDSGTIKYDPVKSHEDIFTKVTDNYAEFRKNPRTTEKGQFQPVTGELEVMAVETDVCCVCNKEHIMMYLEYEPSPCCKWCKK